MGNRKHLKIIDTLRACIRARRYNFRAEITVRDGKGMNDRVTRLPQSLVRLLKLQLEYEPESQPTGWT